VREVDGLHLQFEHKSKAVIFILQTNEFPDMNTGLIYFFILFINSPKITPCWMLSILHTAIKDAIYSNSSIYFYIIRAYFRFVQPTHFFVYVSRRDTYNTDENLLIAISVSSTHS